MKIIFRRLILQSIIWIGLIFFVVLIPVQARNVFWAEKDIQSFWLDAQDESQSKRTILKGFYSIKDAQYHPEKKLIFLIELLKPINSTNIGYILSENTEKKLENYKLVNILKKIPQKPADLIHTLEIQSSMVRDTGNIVEVDFFPVLKIREVFYQDHLVEYYWVSAKDGLIIPNISPARAELILRTAQELKLNKANTKAALSKQLKVGDSVKIIQAVMGFPNYISIKKGLIVWHFPTHTITFRRGRVVELN